MVEAVAGSAGIAVDQDHLDVVDPLEAASHLRRRRPPEGERDQPWLEYGAIDLQGGDGLTGTPRLGDNDGAVGQLKPVDHGWGVNDQIDNGDLGGHRAPDADQDQPHPEVGQCPGAAGPQGRKGRPGDPSPSNSEGDGEGTGGKRGDDGPDRGADYRSVPPSVGLDGQSGPDDDNGPQQAGVVVAGDGHSIPCCRPLDQGLVGPDGYNHRRHRQPGDSPLAVSGGSGGRGRARRARAGGCDGGDGTEGHHTGHREQADTEAGPIGEGMHGVHHPDPGHGGSPGRGQAGGNEGGPRHPGAEGGARTGPLARPAVKGGGSQQPGHQAGRLDGVPCPVATPAELDIGPYGPGGQTDGQQPKGNGEYPPVEGRGDSSISSGRQQGWYEEAAEAGVEDGWVPDHGRVFQHRLEAESVDRGNGQPFEGGSGQHQDEPIASGEQRPPADHPQLYSPRPPACHSSGHNRGPGHHRGPQQQ